MYKLYTYYVEYGYLGHCSIDEKYSSEHPDKYTNAVIYVGNCGATVGSSFHVVFTEPRSKCEYTRLYVPKDEQIIDIKWINHKTLEITISSAESYLKVVI